MPTLEEIILAQKYISAEPDFVQILTEGPIEIRELAPVFIMTGLNGFSELEKMTKRLLYPAYCTVIPKDSWTVESLAKVFAEVSLVHIVVIFCDVPYIDLGHKKSDTWVGKIFVNL